MKKEDKIFRKIRKLSVEVAELSAYKDEGEGDWWGKDTNLGNLTFDIQKMLSKFVNFISEGEK